jgi:hypothetical protein
MSPSPRGRGHWRDDSRVRGWPADGRRPHTGFLTPEGLAAYVRSRRAMTVTLPPVSTSVAGELKESRLPAPIVGPPPVRLVTKVSIGARPGDGEGPGTHV